MVKVKVQTSKPGTWPTSFFPAMSRMSELKAETRYVTRDCMKHSGYQLTWSSFSFPFGSLVPLWSRQIPYTVAKFFFFEKIVQVFYTHVFTAPKETYSKVTQLGVTFASGYLAGVVCAIVSHPADSLVSQLGKADNKGKSAGQIISEVGLGNLATKGLPTRVLMIGTLTGTYRIFLPFFCCCCCCYCVCLWLFIVAWRSRDIT